MYTRRKDELITVREAARVCGRNPETVRRWIWDEKLPAEKLGNQLFIRRSALDSFCRGAKQYRVEKKEDFLERAIRLRERIRARTGREFTEEEVVGAVDEMRQERMNELSSGLR